MPTLTAATAGNSGLSVKFLLRHQFLHRERQRHERARDRRRARAAIRLQHIAVHADGPRAKFFQIKRRAHGTANQPLNFRRTAVDLSLRDVPLFALQGGVGEHRVFRRDPAALTFCSFIQRGTVSSTRHAANHSRIAPFDQRRTGGIGRDVILKTQRTKLAGERPSARVDNQAWKLFYRGVVAQRNGEIFADRP